MRAILDIALNDLRLLFNDRGVLINLVIIPLVITYVVGFANGAGSSGTPTAPKLIVDVIDGDGAELSQQFLTDLRAANANLVLCPTDNDAGDVCQLQGAALDQALALERLKAETSLALMEIPANFTADINAGQNVSIVYRSNESAVAPSYILQAVQAAVQRVGGALTAARVGADVVADFAALQFADEADRAAFIDSIRERASALWAQNPVTVDYRVAQQAPAQQFSGGGFTQSVSGIGTMYVLFAVLPAAAGIILERRNWTLQRLATLPISRAQILGGKLLSRFLIGMIEYGIMFAFGFLLGVRYGSDPVALVLIMIAFALCVTALALALTTLLKNERQAAGIGLFITLTLAPLGGAWWPLEIVPEWMRNIGHISPVAWAMDGFRSLLFQNGNLSTVMVPVLVLLGMTVVFFVYGVARFKFTD
jgi:ABC-2 type transport system permease protein